MKPNQPQTCCLGYKKWYETDSYKDVREIDILEDNGGEDPTRRVQKSDLMRLVTKGLNRNESLDHHSLLLRRIDDEGDYATLDSAKAESARCT
ncbi:MAG: hypothetical protein U0930_03995 [Pirellulales bacterium]